MTCSKRGYAVEFMAETYRSAIVDTGGNTVYKMCASHFHVLIPRQLVREQREIQFHSGQSSTTPSAPLSLGGDLRIVLVEQLL